MPQSSPLAQARMKVHKVIHDLQKQIKQDPNFAADLKSDPGKVLGSLGLHEDSVIELMGEMGATPPTSLRSCTFTCVTTSCCFTSWS